MYASLLKVRDELHHDDYMVLELMVILSLIMRRPAVVPSLQAASERRLTALHMLHLSLEVIVWHFGFAI
eukprot:3529510-Amphidinium_carterae.1